MADLSVRAIDNVSDTNDTETSYKKGDIVSVYETGELDGAAIVPPNWLRVRVTDATKTEVLQYIDKWIRVLDYETLQTDQSIDRALIKSFTQEPGVSDVGAITWSDIEAPIELWSGVYFSEPAANDVRFSITVGDIYKSQGFWGEDPALAGVIITDINYEPVIGVHETVIDISNSSYTTNQVKNRVEQLGGVIKEVSVQGEEAIVEFYRDEVVPRFLAALTDISLAPIRRRKYALAENAVDAGMSQGGQYVTDKAGLSSVLIDKRSVPGNAGRGRGRPR